MKKRNIFITLLFTLLFSSCEKEIEFTGKESTPMIVINSIVCSDSILKAQISKSKFFLANDDSFDTISNADVSVFVNGVFKEKMIYQNGSYESTFTPNTGDKISYQVASNGLKDVSCETVIPNRPEILSIDTTIVSINSYPRIDYKTDSYGNIISTDTTGYSLNLTLSVKIKLHDDEFIKNYYKLSPQISQSNGSNIYSSSIYSTLDGVLSDNQGDVGNILDISGSYNIYGIFSDELFNGKGFTVSGTINIYTNIEMNNLDIPYLYINLQEINEEYYNYLYTRALSTNSSAPFSEPVQIYSNIQDGIGILGAYNNSNNILKIDLQELAKNNIYSGNGTMYYYNMKHKTK